MKIVGEIEMEIEDVEDISTSSTTSSSTTLAPISSTTSTSTTIQELTEIILSSQQWNEIVQSGSFTFQKKKIYRIPVYERNSLNKDTTLDINESELIFGKDNFNQWTETGESQTLFSLNRWNSRVKIFNGKIITGKLIDQVQPFYRTLFTNSSEKDQIGTIELIDIETNMEYGLLYSGSQDQYLTCKAENIDFEGIMFQELKANNGGGLFSYQRNCKLKQIDPPTSFVTNLRLINTTTFESSEPFVKIQNQFIENGNSSNIIFVDGKTFYLPKTGELGNTHQIRPIPNVGDTVRMECFEDDGVRYLRTKEYELQAGDQLSFKGKNLILSVKDRAKQHHFDNRPIENPIGYWIDFKPDLQDIPIGWQEFTVIKSSGLNILGKSISGYMIFKYNKNWQTNIDIDHGLDYMLASNAFGVLSYNHEEITVDWENNIHDGYYRQSQSNVGHSNGYRVVNCTGYKDEFNPPVQVITE